MNEKYYVGSFWLAREETVSACAQRAETYFRFLTACHPSLVHWYRKGRTLEKALQHRIALTKESFQTEFGPEEERSSVFGLFLGLWSGDATGNGSSTDISCGSASPRGSNHCMLNPPHKGTDAEQLLQTPVLAQVLRAMALAWEPEWGVVSSDLFREQLSESAEVGTFLGWVTYLSHRRGPVPPLPPPVRVEPVEDKGTLITLSPERFTASNPAHLAHARLVTSLLSRAGLLGPLRPG
jgi:hypothetical protein